MDLPIRPRAVKLLVKKLQENAILPRFARPGDACLDIFSSEDKELQPGQTVMVGTGLAMTAGPGYEILVRPRSGYASRGVIVTNSPGTVDANYRGEVKVLLLNTTTNPINIKAGDRVAQIAIREVPPTEVVQVESLDTTERGEAGFGSTGL